MVFENESLKTKMRGVKLAQGAFLTIRVSGFPDGFLMAVPGGNSPAAHTVRQEQHQPPENLGKRPCMSEKALLYQPRVLFH